MFSASGIQVPCDWSKVAPFFTLCVATGLKGFQPSHPTCWPQSGWQDGVVTGAMHNLSLLPILCNSYLQCYVCLSHTLLERSVKKLN